MRSIHTGIAIACAMCVALLFLCAAPSSAQKKILFTAKDLPAAVRDAFAKSYPNAKIIGGGKEYENKKTTYEVESMDGTTRRDLIYNPDGTVVEFEEVIDAKALPEAVTASLVKQFKKYEVEKAEQLTRGATTEYEMVIKSGKKMYSVTTDAQGKILSKKEAKGHKKSESKKEKDNEEDEKD